MSFVKDIPAPPRRTDRKVCAYCEATPGSCRGRHFLSGRYCCEACAGDHDTTTKETDR